MVGAVRFICRHLRRHSAEGLAELGVIRDACTIPSAATSQLLRLGWWVLFAFFADASILAGAEGLGKVGDIRRFGTGPSRRTSLLKRLRMVGVVRFFAGA